MPNPYYIRRRKSPILDYAQLALRLYGLKQRADIAKRGQTLTSKELLLKEEQLGEAKKTREAKWGYEREVRTGFGVKTERVSGTEQQRIAAIERGTSVQERLAGLKEREVEVKEKELPITEQNFGMDKVAMFQAGLTRAGLDKAFSGLTDSMRTIAQDDKFNNRVTYQHFKKNWSTYQKIVIDGLQKEMTRIADTNPKKAEELGQMITEVANDKTGMIIDQAMPATAQAIADEQTALAARLRPVSPVKVGAPGSHIIDSEGNIIRTLPSRGPSVTERRATAKDIATAEQKIGLNATKQAMKGQVDFFNQYAQKPYVYIWITKGRNKWRPVKLPKIKGKQLSAKNLWDKTHDPNSRFYGKTVEEMLEYLEVKF